MTLDLDRLTKLLQLTKSPNDHEALSALRKANAALERVGTDWRGLFTRLLEPHTRPQPIRQPWNGWATATGSLGGVTTNVQATFWTQP